MRKAAKVLGRKCYNLGCKGFLDPTEHNNNLVRVPLPSFLVASTYFGWLGVLRNSLVHAMLGCDIHSCKHSFFELTVLVARDLITNAQLAHKQEKRLFLFSPIFSNVRL